MYENVAFDVATHFLIVGRKLRCRAAQSAHSYRGAGLPLRGSGPDKPGMATVAACQALFDPLPRSESPAPL